MHISNTGMDATVLATSSEFVKIRTALDSEEESPAAHLKPIAPRAGQKAVIIKAEKHKMHNFKGRVVHVVRISGKHATVKLGANDPPSKQFKWPLESLCKLGSNSSAASGGGLLPDGGALELGQDQHVAEGFIAAVAKCFDHSVQKPEEPSGWFASLCLFHRWGI